MYFGAENDCGPKPQDDPAAGRYMDHPDCFDNTGYYSEIPNKGYTENPVWIDYLPRKEDGSVELTQTLAMDLALLHSRDYQTQFESVYLTALDLSGNRFEFDTQWFGGSGANFTATGEDFGNARFLNVTANRLGFTKNLPGGGQFATSILNNLFWDFGTGGIEGGSAAFVTTFTQPLLRGAFRHVRLENLTQAERNLLYSVRDFARFRRLFYVDVASSYLNLLLVQQGIRNSRSNVENLAKNLEEYDFYVDIQIASQIERDTVFQQYQTGRSQLLSAEQTYQDALDDFRFQLGLPSWVPVEIDESLLEGFEFVSADLLEDQEATHELRLDLNQYLRGAGATAEALQSSFEIYSELRDGVDPFLTSIEQELATWKSRLASQNMEGLGQNDQLDLKQQISAAQKVEERLLDVRKELALRPQFDDRLQQLIQASEMPAELAPQTPHADEESSRATEEVQTPMQKAYFATQEAIDRLQGDLDELYYVQTLIRLFLIEIEPFDLQQQTAITYAHQNRLDVMNSRSFVMDAFRRVEVAADALESDLSLTGGVTLGSDPSINNAFRFDKSANRYRVGVEFDGPLNRLNERNSYRATQVAYQRASREFVADKDRVANEIRDILRNLELSRLNFQIARQSLVAATRQVDQAQFDLRRATSSDANLTILLLNALEQLLGAKNNLISNWIRYQVQKMRLFAALELLYLDEAGHWTNEDTGLDQLSDLTVIDPEYFPLQYLEPIQSPDDSLRMPAVGPNIEGGSDDELESLPVPQPLSVVPNVDLSTPDLAPPDISGSSIEFSSRRVAR